MHAIGVDIGGTKIAAGVVDENGAILESLLEQTPSHSPQAVEDAIVDLVSTGNTLKANHLVEVERIMDISARLVVNQAALKLKREPIRRILDAFASAIPSK